MQFCGLEMVQFWRLQGFSFKARTGEKENVAEEGRGMVQGEASNVHQDLMDMATRCIRGD